MDKKPRVVIMDLEVDAAAGAADDGATPPESLGDRKAESLADGLLQDDNCRTLKGIDVAVGVGR